MKIDSALQTPILTQAKPEAARSIPSSSFSEQVAAQDTTASSAGRVSAWSDRASFSAKSLSVSTALERSKATQERSSSSSVVSSQAKPYLSADEVSFFEKMMRKTPNYTNGGGYGQSAMEIGGSLSIKA